MKKYKLYTGITGVSLLLLSCVMMNSCTEVQGDGMGTIIWEGSLVPEDSCYRNPVWEPDLSYPSVFKAAVGYYAVGIDNEWSPGLFYTAPVLSSRDLMNWDLRGESFTEKPDWAEGSINGLSVGFAKTKGTYYLFYELQDAGIGMAASKAPQGPYTDYGLLINAESMSLSECSKPFFFSYGSSAYLFFNGGDGIYGQELTLNTGELADLKDDKFKVTDNGIASVNITKLGDWYYLFASVENGDNSHLVIGRAFDIAGPYKDESGTDMNSGGGTELLAGNAEKGFIAIDHTGGVFEDENSNLWILYHTTDVNNPLLSSGTDRHPLMLSQIKLNNKGWPDSVLEATGGWNYPKFAN